MVSIESTILQFSESASEFQTAIFVACCAERTAQLFTGLVGSDIGRSQDVDLAIHCLDLLWENAPQVSWGEIAERISVFPELVGDEEPPGLLAYAYDAAATLYYAVKYRDTGCLTNMISCSSHALNSAEYISEELDDGVDRYENERRNQEADIESLLQVGGPHSNDVIQGMRGRARELSRSRLTELLAA